MKSDQKYGLKLVRFLSEWWAFAVMGIGMTIIFYVRVLRLPFLLKTAIIVVLCMIVVVQVVRRNEDLQTGSESISNQLE